MSFRPVNDRSSQPGLGDSRPSVSSPNPPPTTSRVPLAQTRASNDRPRALRKQPSSNSESQATVHSSSSAESMRVLTPTPAATDAFGAAAPASNGQGSGQESQLRQLSQLAAAQQKMPNVGPRSSVKRSADGAVKMSRPSPPVSPPHPASHSRNASGVSLASTTSSRVTELSSELKTRLSYAMLKVNNGWGERTIDEVETLTSRAVSPASSISTAAVGGAQSSTSPRARTWQHSTPPSAHAHPASSRPMDGAARATSTSPAMLSLSARPQGSPTLAPPVSIQPHRSDAPPRKTSDPKYTPSYLAPPSHHASPHASAASCLHVTPNNRNLRAAADPMVTSPTHSKSEKEAMEALLFMSSPGSANMNVYQPGSQPLSNLRNGTTSVPTSQRKALPTSAPKRKGLPNGRPTPGSQPPPAAHSPQKRVGFERSPPNPGDMMDLDDASGMRRNHVPPPVRVTNGTLPRMKPARYAQGPKSEPRLALHKPGLDVKHLDKVLDRLAAEDSSSDDSESEILLPSRP